MQDPLDQKNEQNFGKKAIKALILLVAALFILLITLFVWGSFNQYPDPAKPVLYINSNLMLAKTTAYEVLATSSLNRDKLVETIIDSLSEHDGTNPYGPTYPVYADEPYPGAVVITLSDNQLILTGYDKELQIIKKITIPVGKTDN
jgi:hypothetical protein